MGRPRKSVEAFLPRARSENTETFRETGEQWTPAKPRARAQQNCWFSAVLRGPSQTLRPPKCYFLADHPPRGHVPSWNSWKHHKGGPRSLGSVVFLSRDHRVSTCGQSPPGTEGFPDAIASFQVSGHSSCKPCSNHPGFPAPTYGVKALGSPTSIQRAQKLSQWAKEMGNPGSFAPVITCFSSREAAKAVTFPEELEIKKRSASFFGLTIVLCNVFMGFQTCCI